MNGSNAIKWYDYVIPTTMFGAIVFGLLITIIVAILNKKESGSWIRFSASLTAGMISTIIIAYILGKLGYFN